MKEYILDAHVIISKYPKIKVEANNPTEAREKAQAYIEKYCEDLKTVKSELEYFFLPAEK